MTVARPAVSAAAEAPAATVHAGDRAIPVAELRHRAARAASALAAHGVGPGRAVALLMRNDPAFLEATLAVGLLGAYAVPLNWHFTPAGLAYVIGDCEAAAVVAHADLLPLLDLPALQGCGVHVVVVETPPELRRAFELDEAACRAPAALPRWERLVAAHEPWRDAAPRGTDSVIYTSGTTGRPKGVRRQRPTVEQEERIAAMRARVYGLVPGVRLIVPAPLYHAAPNVFSMRALQIAEALVLMPRFDAEELLRLIERHRATTVVMVPTMFVRLLRLPEAVRRRYDLSSLRGIYHAAAPCPPEVKRAMIDWWGPIINEWYGTTESSVVTWVDSADWLAHPGTVGRPIDGARVEIVGPGGTTCAPGEAGEVYVGLDDYPDFTYHRRDDDRRSIARGTLISGGDIGYLDADGYLYLCDRKRDMVISGGVNIYPAEIEAALLELPWVQDCAVIGVPDAEFGEAVLALVVLHEPPPALAGDDAAREALRAHLAARLARYKLPRRFEFRAALPRDDAGKLLKRVLREPYWQGQGRRV
ncbi:MAG: AMP-binding protein [Rubrivivax sp.]|nr:AMP-binding protein [Rubrivivax sp.]